MDISHLTNSSLSLLSRKPAVAISYTVVLATAAVTGTIGNVLIIGTLLTTKMKHVVGSSFIGNLALADLVVTAVINPFAIVGVLVGGSFFLERYWLCKTLGSVCVIACSCSLLTIGCISINRYIYIRHRSSYDRIYTRTNSILMCVATWFIGFLLDLPSHTGWSSHHFDGKVHKCLWDREQYYYSVFFVSCGVCVPLVIITGFYYGIYREVSNVKRRLQMSQQCCDRNPSSKKFSGTLKQAKIMFIIFVAFTTCWLPYVIVLVTDKYDTFSIEAHLYCSLFAHIHASINFVIYGLSNRRFRQGYAYLLCCRSTSVCHGTSGGTSSGSSYLNTGLKSASSTDHALANGPFIKGRFTESDLHCSP